MQGKPEQPPSPEAPDPKEAQVPPRKDPKKAAGSLNPKEKNAFYEAIVQKTSRRKTR
jgi:hypothetical protein